MNKNIKITDSIIKKSIARRHRDDFCAFELTLGSGWNNHGRVDAFAMKKSWANPLTIIYEIKVSRSDFVNDNKWMQYIPYCNQFFYVCPHGLIEKEEIPADVGLLYVTRTESALLRTVKKASYRSIDATNEVLAYKRVLMSKLSSDRYPFHSDAKDFWKAWLKNKSENKGIGLSIRSELAREYFKLKKETRHLRLFKEDITAKLQSLGLNKFTFKSEIENLREIKPTLINSRSSVKKLRQAIDSIDSVACELEAKEN